MVDKRDTPERLERAQVRAEGLGFAITQVGDQYWLWDNRNGGHELIGGEWKLYKIERWLDDYERNKRGPAAS